MTKTAGLDSFRHETGAFGKKWFPETMGAGGGFIDYDGDGWQDLLVVGGGAWPDSDVAVPPALWLYRNNGDGTFTLATDQAGLGDTHAYGFGITAADYDNNGDQDVFPTTLHENMLFRNDGGVFTEVGREAGLADHAAWSTASLFFDADGDGWLDLYVGNFVAWTEQDDLWCTTDGESKAYCTPLEYEGLPARFYRNNGDGTFTEETRDAGFDGAPGKTLGVALLDYNRDLKPDLVVANDTNRDLLYENNGDGTFTERGVLSGIAFDENGKTRVGMGIDAGVVDNSGGTTVFVGNFSDEMAGVYRHVSNGLFVDRAAASGVGRPSLLTLTFGLFLADLDLDSDLDLFLANGHVEESIERIQEGITYRQPAQFFLNVGGGLFEERNELLGGVFRQRMVARGAAYADYDRDGDVDILITENGGPIHLWRNDVRRQDAGPHFLRVRVEGRQSNRDGIGTRLIAVAGGRRMEQLVRTGSSYLSQSELPITFGLGETNRIDSLLVYWPSGTIDVFEQVPANQEIVIREGVEEYEQVVAVEPVPLAGR